MGKYNNQRHQQDSGYKYTSTSQDSKCPLGPVNLLGRSVWFTDNPKYCSVVVKELMRKQLEIYQEFDIRMAYDNRGRPFLRNKRIVKGSKFVPLGDASSEAELNRTVQSYLDVTKHTVIAKT